MQDADTAILMAKIGAPHGIKGEVRVKSYTDDPMALGDYEDIGGHIEAMKPFGAGDPEEDEED